MRLTLLVLLLILSSTTLYAQDISVYRWVDENNVVHFSHDHPTDKDFSEVDIRVSYANSDKSNKNGMDSIIAERNKQKENQENLAVAKENEELFKKNCESAQVNLKILSGFIRVVYTDENGQERIMTDEERASQLELSKKYEEIYCKTTEDLPQ